MEASNNLFIVGVNLGEYEARSLVNKGALERLRYKDGANAVRVIRGVYLRAGLSRGERKKVLRDNALRITSLIHRKGVNVLLSGPTALNQGEVNGAVHLASINSYGSKIIEGGFVIHYQRMDEELSPDMPLMRALMRTNWIEDEFGRFSVNSIPDELVLLYSCLASMSFIEGERKNGAPSMQSEDPEIQDGGVREQRSRDRNMLSIIDQKRLVERMKAEMGGVSEVKKALERMASRFGRMRSALERAHELVESNYRYSAFVAPSIELMARFGSVRIGEITENNALWRFENKTSLPLMEFVRNPALVKPGDVPVFFEALLPERFKPVNGNERSNFYRMFTDGSRYLNSVSVQNMHAPHPLIEDRIGCQAALSMHLREGGVFAGRVALEVRETPERRVQKDLLTRLCEVPYEPGHPFIPGMQEKAACNLDEHGVLRFAKDLPFTHIIKFPGAETFASKGANEWLCMQLLEAAGVKVNAHALVDIPGAGIAYLAERFDIPSDAGGTGDRVLCFEDFCGLMNIGIHKKYDTIDLVNMASLIYTESSAPLEDLGQFFRQIVGTVLLGNFDGHARNFGLISSLPASRLAMGAQGPLEPLGSLEGLKIRLAPAFDVLSTVIYPFPPKVPLSMAGHRTYNQKAVIDFGRQLGVSPERTQNIVSQMGRDMVRRVNGILKEPPEMIAGRLDIINAIDQVRCRVERVCHEFGIDPYAENGRHEQALADNGSGASRPTGIKRP